MNFAATHWHHVRCNPCAPACCCELCRGPMPPMLWFCAPGPTYGAGTGYPQVIPYELSVDAGSTPQEVLIGGKCDVHLSLEYLADTGAAAPSVDVKITSDGTTSTWSESPIPSGYQVKSDFMTVKPGAKVALAVTEAIAKLRWCETICC